MSAEVRSLRFGWRGRVAQCQGKRVGDDERTQSGSFRRFLQAGGPNAISTFVGTCPLWLRSVSPARSPRSGEGEGQPRDAESRGRLPNRSSSHGLPLGLWVGERRVGPRADEAIGLGRRQLHAPRSVGDRSPGESGWQSTDRIGVVGVTAEQQRATVAAEPFLATASGFPASKPFLAGHDLKRAGCGAAAPGRISRPGPRSRCTKAPLTGSRTRSPDPGRHYRTIGGAPPYIETSHFEVQLVYFSNGFVPPRAQDCTLASTE